MNLLCNGKTIAVTRNLHEALWQLRENRKRLARLKRYTRSHNQPLHFWIDAICINQGNNKEKSFQVGLMREIYEWADHVFVWLGPADKSSDAAIRCIETIGSKAEACGFEDGTELGAKIWHEIEFVSGGYQRVVSANPWYGNAMKSLFDFISGRSSQSNVLPITDLKKFLHQTMVDEDMGLTRSCSFQGYAFHLRSPKTVKDPLQRFHTHVCGTMESQCYCVPERASSVHKISLRYYEAFISPPSYHHADHANDTPG